MPVDRVMDYLNVTLAPTFQDIQKLIHEPPVSKFNNIQTEQFYLSSVAVVQYGNIAGYKTEDFGSIV